MNRQGLQTLAVLAVLQIAAGCASVDPGTAGAPDPPAARELARAESLFRQERYTEAMIECVDLSRKDPLMPGLPELQQRIVTRLAELRARAIELGKSTSDVRMDQDIEARMLLPDTYGLRRGARGETGAMRTPPTPMEQVLRKPVTVHLKEVNLRTFILAIGASEDVNIIADDSVLDSSKGLTVHAEDTPLAEILAYVSRNFGIQFSVGDNVIWASAGGDTEPAAAMETRLYRLRKGISSEEIEAGDEGIDIIEAIQRFVPAIPGSDILFNRKAHVLLARNTRENLARIEDIIEALDICPPQVLIEARFISTSFSDLSELGVDWILNSPIILSRKKVKGEAEMQPHTQIDQGATIGFTPFSGEAQGLNLTYQGLLTDPMFQAVLHALETSGKSRTLSVPKVTTVNNHPAVIRIGEDFRYFEEYDVQTTPSFITDEGSTVYSTVIVPVGSPQLEELGIELQVTPSVGADLRDITLNILPEISEFVRYERYEIADTSSQTTTGTAGTNTTSLVKLPIFRRSRIETELIAQSGETVVMGGLISSSEDQSSEKVPLLSSVPLIGRLFRHDGVEESRKNLLIFVTATILSERGENLLPLSDAAAAVE